MMMGPIKKVDRAYFVGNVMHQKRQALIIADLGFGDAGKGTTIDFLTRHLSAHTIVRYNGGPQAAHNVVTLDGRQHTFSQFGSGMFVPDTRTLLSRFMLINPLNMLKEERHLADLGITDAFARTFVDRRALIITPFQKTINRLREMVRATNRHGSCGEGVGECMADKLTYGDAVLLANDLTDRVVTLKKLMFIRDARMGEFETLSRCLPESENIVRDRSLFTSRQRLEDCVDVYHHFANCVTLVDDTFIRTLFDQAGTLLFEGAQGVLLDENYGFAPYTTWSTTTFANAEHILNEDGYTGEVVKMGVLRTYATRHGAGPFPTEDLTLQTVCPEPHNTWNDWQRTFRIGHLDLVMLHYALAVAEKPDYLVVTHIDRIPDFSCLKVCLSYVYQGKEEDEPEKYFEFDDNHHIKNIQHIQEPDLDYHEKLTQRIFSCTPYYQTISHANGQAYLSWLEQQLSIPIAITSSGPTALDKHYLLPLLE